MILSGKCLLGQKMACMIYLLMFTAVDMGNSQTAAKYILHVCIYSFYHSIPALCVVDAVVVELKMLLCYNDLLDMNGR